MKRDTSKGRRKTRSKEAVDRNKLVADALRVNRDPTVRKSRTLLVQSNDKVKAAKQDEKEASVIKNQIEEKLAGAQKRGGAVGSINKGQDNNLEGVSNFLLPGSVH